MQGKVLGNGIISGDDGNRYSFSNDDVKNGNINVGATVDFVVDEQNAKEIYIIKDNFSNLANLKDSEIENVKKNAYIAYALMIFSFIPLFGSIFLVGAVFLLAAIYKISKISNSKTLFKNSIIATIFAIFGIIILAFSGTALMFIHEFKSLSVIIIFGFILILIAIYFSFKAYKELSFITENKLFLISFYVRSASFLLILISPLNIITSVIASIIEIYAWYKLEKIKQS